MLDQNPLPRAVVLSTVVMTQMRTSRVFLRVTGSTVKSHVCENLFFILTRLLIFMGIFCLSNLNLCCETVKL